MYIDLDGTNIAAGATKRGGEWQVGIVLHIQVRRQYGADGTCNRCMITMAAASPVHRTGIETCCAPDALQ